MAKKSDTKKYKKWLIPFIVLALSTIFLVIALLFFTGVFDRKNEYQMREEASSSQNIVAKDTFPSTPSFNFNEMEGVETEVITKDGYTVHKLTKKVECIPDDDYTIDITGKLLKSDSNYASYDEMSYVNAKYGNYGGMGCTVKDTGTFYLPDDIELVNQHGGRYRATFSDGNFSISSHWVYFADGTNGALLYDNDGYTITLYQNDATLEKWTFTLIPVLNEKSTLLINDWKNAIGK